MNNFKDKQIFYFSRRAPGLPIFSTRAMQVSFTLPCFSSIWIFVDILFETQRREESSLGSKQYVCANQVGHDINMT